VEERHAYRNTHNQTTRQHEFPTSLIADSLSHKQYESPTGHRRFTLTQQYQHHHEFATRPMADSLSRLPHTKPATFRQRTAPNLVTGLIQHVNNNISEQLQSNSQYELCMFKCK